MEDFLLEYGLYAFIGILFLDDLGFPLPASTVLFASSVYAHSHNEFDITSMLITAIIIPPISNQIMFLLGKHGGKRWLETHGYKVFLPERRMKKAKEFLKRYGEKIIFLLSCATSVRPFSALIAGSLSMNHLRFTIFNILGVFVWAVANVSAGYILGEKIWTFLRGYWYFPVLAIIIYSLIHILYLFIKRKKIQLEKKNHEKH